MPRRDEERPRLVLASASPRRRELLAEAGLAFEVDPAGIEELLSPGVGPEEAARSLAEQKARAVVAHHRGRCWVLGADTIVAVADPPGAWELLGKPALPEHASRMLARLSGTRHLVVTGIAVACADTGAIHTDGESTWVSMRPITRDEIQAYVASGEWRDKAGGYAIQETADRFVCALEGGGLDNVVGLPVRRALALLERAGAPLARLQGRRAHPGRRRTR